MSRKRDSPGDESRSSSGLDLDIWLRHATRHAENRGREGGCAAVHEALSDSCDTDDARRQKCEEAQVWKSMARNAGGQNFEEATWEFLGDTDRTRYGAWCALNRVREAGASLDRRLQNQQRQRRPDSPSSESSSESSASATFSDVSSPSASDNDGGKDVCDVDTKVVAELSESCEKLREAGGGLDRDVCPQVWKKLARSASFPEDAWERTLEVFGGDAPHAFRALCLLRSTGWMDKEIEVVCPFDPATNTVERFKTDRVVSLERFLRCARRNWISNLGLTEQKADDVARELEANDDLLRRLDEIDRGVELQILLQAKQVADDNEGSIPPGLTYDQLPESKDILDSAFREAQQVFDDAVAPALERVFADHDD